MYHLNIKSVNFEDNNHSIVMPTLYYPIRCVRNVGQFVRYRITVVTNLFNSVVQNLVHCVRCIHNNAHGYKFVRDSFNTFKSCCLNRGWEQNKKFKMLKLFLIVRYPGLYLLNSSSDFHSLTMTSGTIKCKKFANYHVTYFEHSYLVKQDALLQ